MIGKLTDEVRAPEAPETPICRIKVARSVTEFMAIVSGETTEIAYGTSSVVWLRRLAVTMISSGPTAFRLDESAARAAGAVPHKASMTAAVTGELTTQRAELVLRLVRRRAGILTMTPRVFACFLQDCCKTQGS